ncbi:MAG: GIY-YIG nuclease family protein [Acidobacteriota bacterium]
MILKHIYALIDPRDHIVRYVGQTENIMSRFQSHCTGNAPATKTWVRELLSEGHVPILVVLETVEHRRIRPIPGKPSVNAAAYAEAKWLKRFRRTAFNHDARICGAAWDLLKNSEQANAALRAL